MSKLSVIAKLTATDGKESELEAALASLVTAADAEDGLEVYSAHAANDEPGVFYFFEIYRDADALAVHGKTDGMRAAMGAVGALLAGRPEVIGMRPVAAKGLAV